MVYSLTEDPQDIYWLAQCLYLTAQYHRASHALRSRKLDKVRSIGLKKEDIYIEMYS